MNELLRSREDNAILPMVNCNIQGADKIINLIFDTYLCAIDYEDLSFETPNRKAFNEFSHIIYELEEILRKLLLNGGLSVNQTIDFEASNIFDVHLPNCKVQLKSINDLNMLLENRL